MELTEERIRNDFTETVGNSRRTSYTYTCIGILVLVAIIMIIAGLLAKMIVDELRLSGGELITAFGVTAVLEVLILMASILLMAADYRKKKRQFDQKKEARLALLKTAPYQIEVLHCVKKHHNKGAIVDGQMPAFYLYFAERKRSASVSQKAFRRIEVGDKLHVVSLTEDAGVLNIYLEKAQAPGDLQWLKDCPILLPPPTA